MSVDKIEKAFAAMLPGMGRESRYLLHRLQEFQQIKRNTISRDGFSANELTKYLIKHGWRHSGSMPGRKGKVDGLMDAAAIIAKHGPERGLRIIYRYALLLEKAGDDE